MIYANAFSTWFMDFINKIGNFFTGGSPSFAVYERIILAVLIILAGWGLSVLYKVVLRKALKIQPKMYIAKKKQGKKSRAKVNAEMTAKGFIIPFVNILHWLFIAVLVVSVLGVNLSSTAGVLSAITVALGLALQDVIGCFASGLIVLATKPLSVGEYVSIKNDYGQCEGTVVSVGIMMTQLNTFDGHFVYIPNSNIQKSIVTNINRDPYRRLDTSIGVAYDSDIELVKSVLQNIGDSDARVIKDRGVKVLLTNIKDSSLEFTLRVWTSDDDYWATKFDFNERVILAFRENNINIPYNIIAINADQEKK